MSDNLEKDLFLWKILCYTIGGNNVPGGFGPGRALGHAAGLEDRMMKRVKTLTSSTLKESMKKGGCGECQTSCQSACKTSCTVGNQSCENRK